MARRAASISRALMRSGSSALRPIGAEIERGAGLGGAVDAALVLLAELGALGLKHGFFSLRCAARVRAADAADRCCGFGFGLGLALLGGAMGSCSMISPLKIQTLTPQVP